MTAFARARRAIEREVGEADVGEEAHAVARLANDVRGDREFMLRQGQRVQPSAQKVHGHRGNLRDVLRADLHVQRIELELRAVANRASLRRLILPQKNADVLLILFRLERFEMFDDAEESLGLAVQQLLVLHRSEIAPRAVHRNPFAFRKLSERAALVVVARHRPRMDRTL